MPEANAWMPGYNATWIKHRILDYVLKQSIRIKYHILVLHSSVLYPALHPLVQVPFTWLHVPSEHCPQVSLQFCP